MKTKLFPLTRIFYGFALCMWLPLKAYASTPEPLTPEAQTLLEWIQKSQDNGKAAFAILDKRQAQLWLFDAQAKEIGQTPVLVGAATGDASVPGIGERPIQEIKPHERTTPAGRFYLEPGKNAEGEDIFWVDYDAALSMHRVRAKNSEKRLQRLASPTPKDNRISYGCINIPVAFYDDRLKPTLTAPRGVLYVLPENQPLQSLFNSEPSPIP